MTFVWNLYENRKFWSQFLNEQGIGNFRGSAMMDQFGGFDTQGFGNQQVHQASGFGDFWSGNRSQNHPQFYAGCWSRGYPREFNIHK